MTGLRRALAALALLVLGSPAAAQAPSYLMLVDRLDRPEDGYCVDVLGAGRTFRTDLPLNVHNCKPGAAPDGLVTHRTDGTLYMAAFDLCLTAYGVNRVSLPGAPVLLRPCGANEGFFPTAELQSWTFDDTGQVRLQNSALCLRAGSAATRTFSPTHRWRTLTLDLCEDAPPALSRWTLVAR
ncbi:MAG: RICIN domain-containing protein [Pseudomonadota bacterium]